MLEADKTRIKELISGMGEEEIKLVLASIPELHDLLILKEGNRRFIKYRYFKNQITNVTEEVADEDTL